MKYEAKSYVYLWCLVFSLLVNIIALIIFPNTKFFLKTVKCTSHGCRYNSGSLCNTLTTLSLPVGSSKLTLSFILLSISPSSKQSASSSSSSSSSFCNGNTMGDSLSSHSTLHWQQYWRSFGIPGSLFPFCSGGNLGIHPLSIMQKGEYCYGHYVHANQKQTSAHAIFLLFLSSIALPILLALVFSYFLKDELDETVRGASFCSDSWSISLELGGYQPWLAVTVKLLLVVYMLVRELCSKIDDISWDNCTRQM